MGRPRSKDETLVRTAVEISPELLVRLDAEAERRDIGRGRLLRAVIALGLTEFEGRELP